jgi:His/Glu/Gln/Arg/opine family amino acid ABC transporter permease subunit
MLNTTFQPIIQAAPLLGRGLISTLQFWFISLLLSFSFGTIWGILRCKQVRIPYLSPAIEVITFVLRGIPFYVQLLLAYFVVPALLDIDISAQAAGIGTLACCSAAYVSQIICAGIDALDPYQWEAAYVLGYSTPQTLRYIIMPQVLKNMLPALAGEFDQLLKTTAVLSTIGILELTGVGKNIIAQEMNPISMYSTIAVLYLCLSSLLTLLTYYTKRRLQA